jgi:hypothetical protein
MTNELEKFIDHNREGFDKEMPDPAVLNRVLERMQAKKVQPQNPKGIVVPFRVLRLVAASVVLMIGGGICWMLLNRPKQQDTRIVKTIVKPRVQNHVNEPNIVIAAPRLPKAVDVIDADLEMRKRLLMTSAKERQFVLAGLNDMQSPASRINAVAKIQHLKNTGADVINALVNTLNTDPNANVRLAALDGLARFYREDNVRKMLVRSLKKQKEPIVQIALIELLTRMRASGIMTELEKLAADETTLKEVRDCAYSNIFNLSST